VVSALYKRTDAPDAAPLCILHTPGRPDSPDCPAILPFDPLPAATDHAPEPLCRVDAVVVTATDDGETNSKSSTISKSVLRLTLPPPPPPVEAIVTSTSPSPASSAAVMVTFEHSMKLTRRRVKTEPAEFFRKFKPSHVRTPVRFVYVSPVPANVVNACASGVVVRPVILARKLPAAMLGSDATGITPPGMFVIVAT